LRAARELSIAHNTLRCRIEKYGLRRSDGPGALAPNSSHAAALADILHRGLSPLRLALGNRR